ncbi:sulfurtransferase complex subunit TusB [Saccharobesus litoralis]|uniref:Sulfurtransferase complex subunit TusB n=1 Tax=Saccharobesus litoralis TaxID=2172099 RepID=A0A2S0VVC0_9ALTE|nr:sulfurtransferase complex subunit TusB [Saccharobesus litoralis]AWB68122.1 sulfurtransferase complex subunit TusB [Saccharobesus litoralis]
MSLLINLTRILDIDENDRLVQFATEQQASILLSQDGVYSLPQVTVAAAKTEISLYILHDDALARGETIQTTQANLTKINYADFVELTLQHHSVFNW